MSSIVEAIRLAENKVLESGGKYNVIVVSQAFLNKLREEIGPLLIDDPTATLEVPPELLCCNIVARVSRTYLSLETKAPANLSGVDHGLFKLSPGVWGEA